MSMSMKDLQASSDEEDEDLSYVQKLNNHTKSSNSPTDKENSDSLKKLSSMVTQSSPPNSSLNSSTEESIEENNSWAHAQEIKMPRHTSESDLKAIQEVSTEIKQQGFSKKEWLKGHVSSYISKSKNYYYNRNSATYASDSSSLNASADSNFKEIDPTMATIRHTSSPDISKLEHDTTPKIYTAVSLSSVSSDEGHFPKKETPASGKNTFLAKRESLPVQKADGKPKIVSSRLKFSDLLHSNASSPSESLEEIVTPSISVQADKHANRDSEDFTEIEMDYLTDQIIKDDLKFHLRPNSGNSITFFNLWISSLFMYGYLIHTLPTFLSGVITGAILTFLIGCIMIWLLCPSAEIYDQYHHELKNFLLEDIKKSKQPENIKTAPKPDVLRKPRDIKGWMNLTFEFNNVLEKENLKDVYVVIHKETLFLFISKNKFEEKENTVKSKRKDRGKNKMKSRIQQQLTEQPTISFEREIQIDLMKCSLQLMPIDLPIRRIWSKKYPMELTVPVDALRQRDVDVSLEELTLSINDIIEGLDFVDIGAVDPFAKNTEESLFYFFGNTGREKEDWFYRMQLCIEPLKHQVTFQDIRQQRLSDQPSKSYPHYMTELITESEKVMQRNVKGKKMEPYLAWLNIFLGRAFWDFWHDKYWTDKFHQKIQSRLSKINTPPFITNIKLKDLNCGHNIPIIHKGSAPVLDEYGIWTDLQVTYKGYFTLTLETQLNVDYYVDLVSSIVKTKTHTDLKENPQLSKMTKLSGIANTSTEDIDLDECQNLGKQSDVEEDDDDDEFLDAIPDVYLDEFDGTDGDDNEIMNPVMSDPRTKAFLESRTGKKVVGLVGWLAKSKLAKRVAETDFAKKAYERAYEKFRKMPIILKVEIQSLRGNLAINIPPPPTNRLWFGFRNNPVIFITATPKVGDKQVRLTYLTSWIEKKLKEEFKKALVLPSMQDISIKLMDSQLKDLYPDRPSS